MSKELPLIIVGTIAAKLRRNLQVHIYIPWTIAETASEIGPELDITGIFINTFLQNKKKNNLLSENKKSKFHNIHSKI